MSCEIKSQPGLSTGNTEIQSRVSGRFSSWSYFNRINDRQANCKICYKLVTGLTNTIYHLKAHHADVYKIYLANRTKRRLNATNRSSEAADSEDSELDDDDSDYSDPGSEQVRCNPKNASPRKDLPKSPRSACRPCFVHMGSPLKTRLSDSKGSHAHLVLSNQADADRLRKRSLAKIAQLEQNKGHGNNSSNYRPAFDSQRPSTSQNGISSTVKMEPTGDNAEVSASNAGLNASSASAFSKRRISARTTFTPTNSPNAKRCKSFRRHGAYNTGSAQVRNRATAPTLTAARARCNTAPRHDPERDRQVAAKMQMYDERFEELFGARINDAQTRRVSASHAELAFANPDEQSAIIRRQKQLSTVVHATRDGDLPGAEGVRALIWCRKTPLAGYGTQNQVQYVFQLADD